MLATQNATPTPHLAGMAVITEEQATHLQPGLHVTIEAGGDLDGYAVTGHLIGLVADTDGLKLRVLADVDRLERQVPLPARVLAHV